MVVSASASLSAAVAAVAVEREVIVKEVTEDVMLERARRVHHPESLLLNCKSFISELLTCNHTNMFIVVVDSDVVLDVVEPLLLLRFDILFRLLYASTDIPNIHFEWFGLGSGASGRVIAIAGEIE
jgi:hypothetical protein